MLLAACVLNIFFGIGGMGPPDILGGIGGGGMQGELEDTGSIIFSCDNTVSLLSSNSGI